MGLIGHGIVFGLGYMTGTPQGRQQLVKLRGQAVELTRHPEVKRVRERGWDLAQAQAAAARRGVNQKLRARSSGAAANGSGGDNAGAAADLHAALPDTHTTPPDTHTAPDTPTPSPGPSRSGFGGTTVAEDSRDAILGLSDPSAHTPPARTPPAHTPPAHTPSVQTPSPDRP